MSGDASTDLVFNHAWSFIIVVCFLVGIGILFEFWTRHLENKFLRREHYYAVLTKMYKELMLFGVFSFALFIADSVSLYGVLRRVDPTIESEEQMREYIHQIHVGLFISVLVYIALVLILVLITKVVGKWWRRTEAFPVEESVRLLNKYKETNHPFLHAFDLRKMVLRENERFRLIFNILRTEFISAESLSAQFRFSDYLSSCQERLVAWLVEIHWTIWGIFVVVLFVLFIPFSKFSSSSNDQEISGASRTLIPFMVYGYIQLVVSIIVLLNCRSILKNLSKLYVANFREKQMDKRRFNKSMRIRRVGSMPFQSSFSSFNLLPSDLLFEKNISSFFPFQPQPRSKTAKRTPVNLKINQNIPSSSSETRDQLDVKERKKKEKEYYILIKLKLLYHKFRRSYNCSEFERLFFLNRPNIILYMIQLLFFFQGIYVMLLGLVYAAEAWSRWGWPSIFIVVPAPLFIIAVFAPLILPLYSMVRFVDKHSMPDVIKNIVVESLLNGISRRDMEDPNAKKKNFLRRKLQKSNSRLFRRKKDKKKDSPLSPSSISIIKTTSSSSSSPSPEKNVSKEDVFVMPIGDDWGSQHDEYEIESNFQKTVAVIVNMNDSPVSPMKSKPSGPNNLLQEKKNDFGFIKYAKKVNEPAPQSFHYNSSSSTTQVIRRTDEKRGWGGQTIDQRMKEKIDEVAIPMDILRESGIVNKERLLDSRSMKPPLRPGAGLGTSDKLQPSEDSLSHASLRQILVQSPITRSPGGRKYKMGGRYGYKHPHFPRHHILSKQVIKSPRHSRGHSRFPSVNMPRKPGTHEVPMFDVALRNREELESVKKLLLRLRSQKPNVDDNSQDSEIIPIVVHRDSSS